VPQVASPPGIPYRRRLRVRIDAAADDLRRKRFAAGARRQRVRIVARVAAAFESPRRYPLGTRLYVRSAAAVLIPLGGTLTYDLRYKEGDVASRVAEALALYQGTFRISSPVYAAENTRVIMGAWDDASIDLDLDVKVNVPTGVGRVAVLVNNLRYTGKPVI